MSIGWRALSLLGYPVIDELWILRDAGARWRWQMRDQYGVTIERSSADWPDRGQALADARVKFGFEGYRVRAGRG